MTIMTTDEIILQFITDKDTLIPVGVILLLVYLTLNQRSRILEWLVLAVTNSEKDLGGGTGQLKLRMVYDWFIQKFPILSAIIPFALFTIWVNKSLARMRTLKDTNIKVASYITNKPVEELKAEAKAQKEAAKAEVGGQPETEVKTEAEDPKEVPTNEDSVQKRTESLPEQTGLES
ncbi:MAG: hypothetical protein J6Y02_14835 [Pseudobutyrivibrio sp.]|nr:hypothetical protein [Pseudobutyrivibrio sp.]